MIVKKNVYGHKKRLQFIKNSIKNYLRDYKLNKKDIKILDVGCGTGNMITDPLAKLGYNIIGLDIDQESIHMAKKLNKYPNCQYKNQSLKTETKTYDVIICSEVLEHLNKPSLLLNEITQKMKLNGICIITVPNGYGCGEIDSFFWKILKMDLIFNRPPKNDQEIKQQRHEKKFRGFCQNSSHLQHFTYLDLAKLFRQNKLIIKQKQGSVPFSGKFFNVLFRNNQTFLNFNLFLGKFLPFLILSGWYFELKKGIK